MALVEVMHVRREMTKRCDRCVVIGENIALWNDCARKMSQKRTDEEKEPLLADLEGYEENVMYQNELPCVCEYQSFVTWSNVWRPPSSNTGVDST